MNISEKDDKNRFFISTKQECKTLASYQDPKTRRTTKRYEDSWHKTRQRQGTRAGNQLRGTQYQKGFKRSAGQVSDCRNSARDARREAPTRGSDDVLRAPRAAPVRRAVAWDRARALLHLDHLDLHVELAQPRAGRGEPAGRETGAGQWPASYCEGGRWAMGYG